MLYIPANVQDITSLIKVVIHKNSVSTSFEDLYKASPSRTYQDWKLEFITHFLSQQYKQQTNECYTLEQILLWETNNTVPSLCSS
jgi:hypothetical protein